MEGHLFSQWLFPLHSLHFLLSVLLTYCTSALLGHTTLFGQPQRLCPTSLHPQHLVGCAFPLLGHAAFPSSILLHILLYKGTNLLPLLLIFLLLASRIFLCLQWWAMWPKHPHLRHWWLPLLPLIISMYALVQGIVALLHLIQNFN